MISNRQGGRRRGRGGGGRAPGAPNVGNRQDNRQRGNAAQLLEKYKGLARDAQMQGDRVQTEYFLQFADHYYRVLNENRARYEEHRRTRDEDEGEEELDEESDARADEQPDRDERGPRRPREAEGGDERGHRQRGRRRPYEGNGAPGRDEEPEERLPADLLPPSISGNVGPEEGEEGEPRPPRRRTRRPRPDEEIAPAA